MPATLILDASTLLNLYATPRLREITSAGPYQLAVAEYVLNEEALFVWELGRVHSNRGLCQSWRNGLAAGSMGSCN